MKKNGAVIIEGHVQGLSNTRSLGEIGIPVYVVDKTDCIARHSKYCKKFFRSPDFQTDQFADFLLDLAVQENIKNWVLIPSNDHAVYTLAKHKERLETLYKVITPDLGIIEKIYDKTALLKLAAENQIPIPVTQCFKTVDEKINPELKFPVITKGRNGLSFYKSTGKKAFLAENEKELRQQLTEIHSKLDISGTFSQELIPFNGKNKTISFTAFCVNGEVKTHWTGIKLREHPVRFGTATFAKSITNEVCLNQSRILLKMLNYTGVCEVEYLQDPRTGEYKLIEINPRTWLWVGLAKACGVDYAKLIYNHVNEIPNVYPEIYDTTKYWINPLSDTAFALPAMLKGQLKPTTYLSSLLYAKKINALYNRYDKKPALAYLLKLFAFLRNR